MKGAVEGKKASELKHACCGGGSTGDFNLNEGFQP